MEILPCQVHLWFAFDEQINNCELLQKYFDIINNVEREQQERFFLKKNRHQYLITRALVRSVLSLYQPHIPPERWRFAMNEYGRPYINNETTSPLYFNLSHTDSLVVLAVSQNSAIGVDVEYLDRKRNVGISKKIFTNIEREQLFSLPVQQYNQRFYELWTLKESYIKALGTGLSIPTTKFSFQFLDPNKPNVVFVANGSEDNKAWQFWRVQPDESHIVSLAVKTWREYKNCYNITMNKYEPLSFINQVFYPLNARI